MKSFYCSVLSEIFRFLSNIASSRFSQDNVTAFALVCPFRVAAVPVFFAAFFVTFMVN